jgi:hypothetical protein
VTSLQTREVSCQGGKIDHGAMTQFQATAANWPSRALCLTCGQRDKSTSQANLRHAFDS